MQYITSILIALFFSYSSFASTVTLTAFEHDADDRNKAARLFFKEGENDWILHDQNGGSTLITLYAVIMNQVLADMSGKKSRKAGNAAWDEIKLKEVPIQDDLKSSLRHTCNRLISTFIRISAFNTDRIEDFRRKLHQDPLILTYNDIYLYIGQWLHEHIDKLPEYQLDMITRGKHESTTKVKFLDSTVAENRVKMSPVIKTLGCIAREKKFERGIPKGVPSFAVKDIAAIMKAYDQNRLNELDHRDREFKTVREIIAVLQNGTVIESVMHIPADSNKDEVLKALKNQGSKKKKKKKKKKRAPKTEK